MGVASLVLGIVAIALNFIGLGFPIGTILGVVGVILGALGRKANPDNSGLATGGMVCSIIGIVLSLLFIVLCASCVGGLGALANSIS